MSCTPVDRVLPGSSVSFLQKISKPKGVNCTLGTVVRLQMQAGASVYHHAIYKPSTTAYQSHGTDYKVGEGGDTLAWS